MKNPMYLLHYSNDSGSKEFIVFADDFKAATLAEHAVGDVTCSNVLRVEEVLGKDCMAARLNSCPDYLPTGRPMAVSRY